MPIAQSGGSQAASNQSLQQILATLGTQQQQPTPVVPQAPAPPIGQPQPTPGPPNQNQATDLSQLLNAMQRPANGQSHAQNSGQLPQQNPPSVNASAPDMSQIMAQLNRYGR